MQPSFTPPAPPNPPYFSNQSLDPAQAAKQMAALSAASQVRMLNTRQSSGTSSGQSIPDGHNIQMPNHFGPPSATNPSFLDPSMSQGTPTRPGQASASLAPRRQGFLNGLASIMFKRNTPLPPALTGVPAPNFDPNTTQFKFIEPSSEIGGFRLAGKDIDLFKLWGMVFQQGGCAVLNNNNGWNALLPHFDLPEQSSVPLVNGTTSVAPVLHMYYQAILLPFEEMYRKNMQEQQKKMAARGGIPPNTVPTRQSIPPTQQAPGTPVQQRAGSVMPPGASPMQNEQSPPDATSGEPDSAALKRKLDSDDPDLKRTRQKTESETEITPASVVDQTAPAAASSTTAQSRPRQPTRRKIEYVPFAREVDSFGGRDLRQVDMEYAQAQRRTIRDLNDWGTVDIEHLTMSLRSRMSTELSYSLTTLTLLSTLKGQSPGSGFPINQCGEMFEEFLDLLETLAFDGQPDSPDPVRGPLDIEVTYRDIMETIQEIENQPFAVLKKQQGTRDRDNGPVQRPGNTILAMLNIIRNLATIADNTMFLAEHPRLLDLMLRLCQVDDTDKSKLRASSPALSLTDLVTVRKDTLYTLTCIATLLRYESGSASARISLGRLYALLVSYIVDPAESVCPSATVQQVAVHFDPVTTPCRPPQLADIALDAFTRIVHSDHNRHTVSKVIPKKKLSQLFTSLVHRLPITDNDFLLTSRELWLCYLERVLLALYTLAFLAPPELKAELKADRHLGFKSVMVRLLHQFTKNSEARSWYVACIRRVIETMKVLDDCEDVFDTSKSAVAPTLSFGMGYGEVGENTGETGTGLLGGHRAWAMELLMLREVGADEVACGELESLARVDISVH